MMDMCNQISQQEAACTVSQITTPELTFQSHFRFGYDGQAFLFRTREEQKWWVDYGSCKRQPGNFKEECQQTARLIRQNADEDIWILFSGGIDSETVLRSFISAGIEVKVAIARFKNDLNVHDISWAVIACEELGVKYFFFDLDLISFWQGEAKNYADISQCISPQLVVTMWLSDQLRGYPVIGGGECLLIREIDDHDKRLFKTVPSSYWSLWEKERIASWYRFFLYRKRSACPGFFQYNPEIILSYLLDPLVYSLVHKEKSEIYSSALIKGKFYQQHFPIQQRMKYTGFEKVQNEDAQLRSQLKKRFPFSDAVFKTKYQDLIRKLSCR